MSIREQFRAKLGVSARDLTLLDELFRQPYVTVASASRILGVSNPTAAKAIGRLEGAGLLREITGRGWGRVFAAEPILETLERPLPGGA